MMAGFSRRLLGILLVVMVSTPLNAYSRRRSRLDAAYQRRSYVRIIPSFRHFIINVINPLTSLTPTVAIWV